MPAIRPCYGRNRRMAQALPPTTDYMVKTLLWGWILRQRLMPLQGKMQELQCLDSG
jgi:hypothetical protein